MLLSFRKARAGDLKQIYRIESSSFHNPYSLDLLLAFILSKTYDIFVAEDANKKILGYTIVTFEQSKKALHIISIAVDREHRKRGIGRKLLNFVFDNYKDKANFAWLEVRKSNKDAIEFYKKNKFVEKGEMENYYEDGEAAKIFVRHLADRTQLESSEQS